MTVARTLHNSLLRSEPAARRPVMKPQPVIKHQPVESQRKPVMKRTPPVKPRRVMNTEETPEADIQQEVLEGFEEDEYIPVYGNIFLLILIFLISPGVLFTIPAGKGGIFMSRQTSLAAAFVHALVLVVIFNYI